MTLILNASTSSGLVVTPDNSGTFAFQTNGTQYNPVLFSGTAVTPTSGSNTFSFINIPSYAKRVTLALAGLNGTFASGNYSITLGTGSTPTYAATGYNGLSLSAATAISLVSSTYFNVEAYNPQMATFTFVNAGGNYWTVSGISSSGSSGVNQLANFSGYISLGAALSAVKVTLLSTDTFSATGSANILYE
jgi:hypothetical protein